MNSKTIISTLVLFFISLTALQAQSDRDLYEVQVDGLGCPFCAYGLEKKFKKFKSLKDLKIDIETGDFSFTYPADEPLTMKEVVDQVSAAGYTPNDAKITRVDGTIVTNVKEEVELGELTSTNYKVHGTCGMCKSRIEKVLTDIPGVATASWDQEKLMVSVDFDKKIVQQEDLEKAVAATGHDTANQKATDEAYENLPACCHYKREK